MERNEARCPPGTPILLAAFCMVPKDHPFCPAIRLGISHGSVKNRPFRSDGMELWARD